MATGGCRKNNGQPTLFPARGFSDSFQTCLSNVPLSARGVSPPPAMFHAWQEKEHMRGQTYLTLEEACADISDYIKAFNNRRWRHSTLGMMSPVEFKEVKIGV